jgi:flagellin
MRRVFIVEKTSKQANGQDVFKEEDLMTAQGSFGASFFNALTSLERARVSFTRSAKRIATGVQDDIPGGPGRAIRLKHDSQGLEAINRSLGGVSSYVSSQEVVLGSVGELYDELNDLAFAATDPILSDEDRAVLNEEFMQIKEQISSFSGRSHNGVPLFGSDLSIQADLDSTMSHSALNFSELELDGGLDISTAAGANQAISDLEDYQRSLNSQVAQVGATQSAISRQIEGNARLTNNLKTSASAIEDVDLAKELVNMTIAEMQANVAVTIMAKIEENQRALFDRLFS